MSFYTIRNVLIAGWLGFFIFFFSACSVTGQRIEPPRVSLSSIKIQDINLFEAVLYIEMRIVNPQDGSYDIKGIDCELDIDGMRLASGVSNTTVHIPSLQSAVVPLTIYSSVDDIAKVLINLKGKEKINYNIKGKLYVAAGFFQPSMLRFKSDGQISLEGFKYLRS